MCVSCFADLTTGLDNEYKPVLKARGRTMVDSA